MNLPIIFRFSAPESSDRSIQTRSPESSDNHQDVTRVDSGVSEEVWQTRQELEALILDKLSNVLDNKQKANKLKNLLFAMPRIDKSIVKTGGKLKRWWMATERFK